MQMIPGFHNGKTRKQCTSYLHNIYMLFVCGQITGLILVITKYKIKKKKKMNERNYERKDRLIEMVLTQQRKRF